jgi:hypothetical protein
MIPALIIYSKQTKQASTRGEAEPTSTEFLPSDATQFALEDIAAPSGFENGSSLHQKPADAPRNLPARRSFDAPLRKSLSDPSALNNKPSLQARPTPMRNAMSAVPEESGGVHEEGPWTAEALDLFDFWPPGRPKPV